LIAGYPALLPLKKAAVEIDKRFVEYLLETDMTTGIGLPSAGQKRFALRTTPSRIDTARSRSNITSMLISAPPLSLMKVSAQPYAHIT
jgi:hypothetical protein